MFVDLEAIQSSGLASSGKHSMLMKLNLELDLVCDIEKDRDNS